MKLHANAALSLKGRRELCRRVVEGERTSSEAAEAAEISVRCARKWVGRDRAEGEPGLLDRSSAPWSIPHRTSEQRIQAIALLRRLRFTGPEIAECLGMALSSVSGVLTTIGMGKLGRLGLEPAVRYERARPGELIHIDVKKLGRIIQPGHRSPASASRALRRIRLTDAGSETPAGSTSTSRSMTAPAWPTPRSWATRRQSLSWHSSDEPLLSSAATGSPWSSCSQTTAADIARSFTQSPAAPSRSATSARAPTAPRPTARQSGSSAPCSAAGPTVPSTAIAANATPPLTAGSGTTTINENTQRSATNPRSPASASEPTYSGLTPSPPSSAQPSSLRGRSTPNFPQARLSGLAACPRYIETSVGRNTRPDAYH